MNVSFLVGAVATLLFLFVVFFFCLRFPQIRTLIILGGALRLVLAWAIGLGLLEITGTTNDARAFEARALEWSDLPWLDLFLSFDPSHSFVISWFGAIAYKLVYPSPVMLNVINAAFSVWLIVLSYQLARRLFGAERAKAAAWIVALFPFAVLYGSVYRREVFGSAFFMIGLLKGVAWQKSYNPFLLVSSIFAFLLAGIFHSGYAVGAVGLIIFAVLMVFSRRRRSESKLSKRNARISGFIAILLGLSFFLGLAASGFALNKVGELGDLDVLEAVEARTLHRVSDGGSSYPSALTGVDPFSNPLVIPGRIIYFLFSPFPWDIRSPGHMLGIFAAVLFSLIFISIYRSRRIIFSNKEALVVLMITLSAILVFAISIDNIGTAVRHRTKFVYPLAALCAVPIFYRVKLHFYSR